LQSVFGGQVCNQFVCQECGNVTNRIEDFYNLSLEVKDIKSMHESLQKNLEGEIINGYQCDGCNKKVDVSKRILISQTPNVLIVHLKRIVFNYDSFKNDKLNSFFEFPYQLDLKPYSFYDVMRKENRIKPAKTEAAEGEDEEEQTPIK
jgi:ubiquitin C-terminal hydrolase